MEKLGLAEMVDLAVMRSKCNDLMWLKRQNKGSAGTFVVRLLIKKRVPLTPGSFCFLSNVRKCLQKEKHSSKRLIKTKKRNVGRTLLLYVFRND